MEHLVSLNPLYGISGFCVGVLVGMTGIGGGSLMTPLLILLFGLHPTTAVGTDLLFAASTKTAGAVVHAAARTVDWMLVRLLAIGSVPATVVTLILLSRFDLRGVVAQHVITVTLGGVLVVTALFLITGRSIRTHYADRLSRLDPRTARLFTVALGHNGRSGHDHFRWGGLRTNRSVTQRPLSSMYDRRVAAPIAVGKCRELLTKCREAVSVARLKTVRSQQLG